MSNAAAPVDAVPNSLVRLLQSNTTEIACRAAASLAVSGGMRDCAALLAALHHFDPRVVRAAERGLWGIWLRAAGENAQRALLPILHGLREGRDEHSGEELSGLIRRHPTYAEAYHQRAIAHSLAGRWHDALRDYARALHLNPHHFAATAGQGHCLTQLGRHREALACLRAARQMHPRLEGVRQAMRRLRAVLAQERAGGEGGWPDASALAGSMSRR